MREFDETNDNDVSMESNAPAETTDCQEDNQGDELLEQQSVETDVDVESPQEQVDEVEEVEEQQDAIGEEEPNMSDYKVMVDGQEFDPNKDPLEGTKMEMKHSELEDAYWANDMVAAEKMKDVGEKMQTGDYADYNVFGPINDMDRMRNDHARNEAEIDAFRSVNQWSKVSYTEEYNPEDFD